MFPSVPRRLRIPAALILALSTVSIAIPVAAAPKGAKLTVNVSALTPAVSVGRDGAFAVVVTNGGNASLTHAILNVAVTGGTLEESPASCTGAPTAACDLGTLVSGDVRTLLFVVGAPAAPGKVDLSAELRVDAGSGNPSRDKVGDDGSINVSANTAFFGAWHGAGNVLDGGISSAHQSASIHVPAVNFDYPAEMSESNDRICGERGFGATVNMAFAEGNPVTPFLTLTVTYDDEARGNRTPGNVKFVHEDDFGTCSFLEKGCETAGCFNAFWQGTGPNKKLVIVALLASNGRGRGA